MNDDGVKYVGYKIYHLIILYRYAIEKSTHNQKIHWRKVQMRLC